MIDEKEVTAYVTMPDCFLQGCSEDIVIFRADGGNHFTDYGIYEGMFLFFDRKKRFKKGRLSCYINTAGDDRPKYRVSDKNIDGYKHLGRLVLTLRNYQICFVILKFLFFKPITEYYLLFVHSFLPLSFFLEIV